MKTAFAVAFAFAMFAASVATITPASATACVRSGNYVYCT
jgi:hypothetical protein